MTNNRSYFRILAANADIQHHMATILEAKAKEMDKAAAWTRLHTQPADYPNHDLQLQDGVRIHERMIEVLEGITKVEAGLARHLKIVLHSESDDDAPPSSSGDLNKLFDIG